MKLTVSEASKLIGVSVRTLHYYDEIGLLRPAKTNQAGYRYYDAENLAQLQQILFYRELGFSLREIMRILSQPDHDRQTALHGHRELLLLKRQQLDNMIRLVDETLGGNDDMNKKQFTFADVEEAKNKYAEEVKSRWGTTDAYRQSEEKAARRSSADTAAVMDGAGEIFEAFAERRFEAPSVPDVQALVRRWQFFITENFYNCTDEILAGLAEMYVADSRFTENLDRYGAGTAKFISEAIKAYCER